MSLPSQGTNAQSLTSSLHRLWPNNELAQVECHPYTIPLPFPKPFLMQFWSSLTRGRACTMSYSLSYCLPGTLCGTERAQSEVSADRELLGCASFWCQQLQSPGRLDKPFSQVYGSGRVEESALLTAEFHGLALLKGERRFHSSYRRV